MLVEDLGGQLREALERPQKTDVLLPDDLVALAVIADERELVANDALAERADRDRAFGRRRARLRRREHRAREPRVAGLQMIARRVRVCGDVEAERVALSRLREPLDRAR